MTFDKPGQYQSWLINVLNMPCDSLMAWRASVSAMGQNNVVFPAKTRQIKEGPSSIRRVDEIVIYLYSPHAPSVAVASC